jgi:hypothetical protein
MEDNRTLTCQLETIRKENRDEHKEILTKLNILCTKVAVTETKMAGVTHILHGNDGLPGLCGRTDALESTSIQHSTYFKIVAAGIIVAVPIATWLADHLWR